MGELQLKEINKVYNNVTAVDEINLTVNDGEFLTLLGPSGCGKTTTLRMIAGFTRPSNGQIYLDGELITSVNPRVFVPPERREMGMVFQTYAVWPHMNVFENVAYPLKFKRLGRAEIKERVERALALVKLEGFAERYPHQLSGGQQQRVALGRALVMEPEVLLLDEPLSNLDAKLREQMREEIRILQRRVGVTIVYVTHDQLEAITMSDRIAVISEGRILQLGTPREIYETPADRFVAGFVGSANFLEALVVGQQGGNVTFRPEGTDQVFQCYVERLPAAKQVTLIVRPENLRLCPPGQADLTGTVRRRTYRGDRLDYLIEVGENQLQVEADNSQRYEEGSAVGVEINSVAALPHE
jgi:iron(III) transport system ATP-binding protein